MWPTPRRSWPPAVSVGQGFGNFYVLTTRPDAATVRRINLLKGRPPDQVGSVVTTPLRIPLLFDWAALPEGLTGRAVRSVMDALFELGPFGFRGPAAAHVPDHLAQVDRGVRTTQVIAPGYACPSNRFLSRALDLVGERPAVRHLGQPVPASDRRPGRAGALAGRRAARGVRRRPRFRRARPSRRGRRPAALSAARADVHDDPRVPQGRPHRAGGPAGGRTARVAAPRTAAVGGRASGVRPGDCPVRGPASGAAGVPGCGIAGSTS